MAGEASSTASKFLKEMFGPSTSQPIYLSSLPNDDARERELPERHVTTRELPVIDGFLKKWDRPGRALYFCTATVIAGQDKRSKETLAELNGIFVDIDFKGVVQTPEEIEKKLRQIQIPPSRIVHSGHGYHCYWAFNEALEATSENVERLERLLRLQGRSSSGTNQANPDRYTDCTTCSLP